MPTKLTSPVLDERVESLLAQMTLAEKVALLSGQDNWRTTPIPRLGIPSIVMTDGPHGVRATAEAGRRAGPTTCFPTGISMGAAWNPELVGQVGQAIADETRAMGCDIILGPCVNLVREPRGGRNFETYSEDPYLAGQTAVGFINGVQIKNVGTSLKHYAVNNYEIERGRASSNVDERTLRELYLTQFEMAVKESQPWTVMCSYNRINGVYASQNDYLLNKILKQEWGFEGLVVSDWGANHTIFSSVAGGLDLEMPGPAKYYKLLAEAVQRWQIDEAAVTEAARRVLRIIVKSGRMDGNLPAGSVNTPEHQALARTLAEEAITLLKNDGLLPIDVSRVKRIAVIGPNAAQAVIEGGGSSHVDVPYRVSPLDALRTRLNGKVDILYEQGCDNYDSPPAIPLEWLTMPEKMGSGLRLDVYRESTGFDGPIESHLSNQRPAYWWWLPPAEKLENDHFAARWSGQLSVPASGKYTFNLRHNGKIRVAMDGETLVENAMPQTGPAVDALESHANLTFEKDLVARQAYGLCIEHIKYPGESIVTYQLSAAIRFAPGTDPRPARAVDLARQADLVLAFLGYQEGFETEGTDRPNIDLPGGQNELVYALTAANPRTVVVLNAGAPVTMPWVDQVAAIVEAYYPGQENGNAVANILLGEVNPSGKLPVTFPKRLEDNPAFINASYPGSRVVNYGEGLFMGYRYYDKKKLEPLFPFGHGLSYTTFEVRSGADPLRIGKLALEAGETVKVPVTIKNTGDRVGKEVVQIYVADVQASLPRPPKELRNFTKLELQPGESKTITFDLGPRAFAFYDSHKKDWIVEPGEYQILVGVSARDVRDQVTVIVE